MQGKSADTDFASKPLDTSPVVEGVLAAASLLCCHLCACFYFVDPRVSAEVFESKESKKYRAPLATARPSQHSELADKVIAYKESMRPKMDEKEQ